MSDITEVLDSAEYDSNPDALHPFEKYVKLGDDLTVYPLYQGEKTEVALIRKQLNLVRNRLHWSDARVSAFVFLKGIKWCIYNIDELKSDKQLVALSNLQKRLEDVRTKKAIAESAKALWQEVDGVNYTEQEYNEDIEALGLDASTFKMQFSMEVPKTKLIRHWLKTNIVGEINAEDAREAMESAGIVENDKDWSLVKNVASTLKMTSGERGKWRQAII